MKVFQKSKNTVTIKKNPKNGLIIGSHKLATHISTVSDRNTKEFEDMLVNLTQATHFTVHNNLKLYKQIKEIFCLKKTPE